MNSPVARMKAAAFVSSFSMSIFSALRLTCLLYTSGLAYPKLTFKPETEQAAVAEDIAKELSELRQYIICLLYTSCWSAKAIG